MLFSDIGSITCPRWTRASQMLNLRLGTSGPVNTKLILLTSNPQERTQRRRTTYFREWSIEYWGNWKIRFFVLAKVILGDDHFSIPKWSNKRPFTATLAEVMWERPNSVSHHGCKYNLGVFSAARVFLEASVRLFCAINNPIAACKIKRCYMFMQSGRNCKRWYLLRVKPWLQASGNNHLARNQRSQWNSLQVSVFEPFVHTQPGEFISFAGNSQNIFHHQSSCPGGYWYQYPTCDI